VDDEQHICEYKRHDLGIGNVGEFKIQHVQTRLPAVDLQGKGDTAQFGGGTATIAGKNGRHGVSLFRQCT